MKEKKSSNLPGIESPSIFNRTYREEIFEAKSKVETQKYPTPQHVKAVLERIEQTRALHPELIRIGIDVKELSHLIALNLCYKQTWEYRRKETVSAKDYEKHIIQRWDKNRPKLFTRKKQLRKFGKASARIIFANEDSHKIRDLTKRRAYLDRFIYDLKRMFDVKTPRPYRYMAAIFNLFDLHPESFCKGCRDYVTPSFMGSDVKLCKRRSIFTCLKHEKARVKIWHQFIQIGNQVPPAMYPRNLT